MDEEKRAVVDILNSVECQIYMSIDVIRDSKNKNKSIVTRLLGNARFKQSSHNSGVHENILQLYSLSAMRLPPGSEDLATVYANRSAVMIHLWMYEDCIKEIDRAMNITKNDLLKIKLFCRKARCLHALGLEGKEDVMSKAEALFNNVKNGPSGKTFADLMRRTKLSLDVPIRHKNLSVRNDKKSARVEDLHKKHIINDFSLVDVQYNEKYGRHLVAKRDINPGEIIFIEEPYMHCLDLVRGYTYCFHCLTPCLITIPCEHCGWAMFCSEGCKQQAWVKYHDLECAVYDFAKENVDGDGVKHMAVKSLICAVREAGGVDQLRDELKAFDSCTDKLKGFVKDGKIQSSGFKSIYALSSNTSDKAEPIHKNNTIMILRALVKNTKYFGKKPGFEKTEELKKDDKVLFLGSLVYKLSKIFQLNSRIIPIGRDFYTTGLDARMCENKQCCTTGLYIAPITSLLNHSCIPNVKRCFSNNYSVIVYAVQPIKKGSQLFDCYQQEFYEYNISPRQKHLKKTYNFNCDCKACKEKWDIVEYEVVSKKNLKKNAPEWRLADEYLQLIQAIHDKKIELSEKHIDILTRGIKKACQSLNQPSFMTTNLMRALNVVFRRLYGIEFMIPDKCNNL
ncbi:SET and MYND domain-containing protein 4-like [Nasonia vitripennis]|uniref:SET and MYND domain-containing protein 4 n=1 Tax=Nasonia vitripennis TaxID=7425 RepID=A0A7M7GAY5_NASVI|nr:SET and MYND domain-containing protein 4-like [Nasonia vitripennis]